MLSVMLKLEHMHCHEEADNFYSSEPYLWTVFFHADINTVTLGFDNMIATYTPHANWTTRGLYPNGVKAGDDVDIPASMGVRKVILDDGGAGIGMVGVLFVLLEQDQTPGNAISAGHQALAEATNFALNDYVNSKFPEIIEPTPSEIQIIADQIQGEVEDAIKDKLSWYHFLHDHDDVFGFGHQFLLYDELSSLASQTPPEQSFSARIHHEKVSQKLVNDYEIFGKVLVRPYPPPPDPCANELEAYNAAVKALKDINDTIKHMQNELQTATGGKKQALLIAIKWQQETLTRPAAEAVASTRAAYEACRNRVSVTITDYLKSIEKLRLARDERIAGRKPNQFRKTAVVAPGRTYPSKKKK